ncbi:MAG: c-type cytochrome, partial [Planctomycetaceae bacterium]|nr:c-type cytochrome [Planctomycetaceae bacterium]
MSDSRSTSLLSTCLLLLLSIYAGNNLSAQEDDDAISLPGVLGRYQHNGREYFERIDPDIAFDWGTRTPDQRLPAEEFEIDWTSLILIRQKAPLQFHAYIAGDVEVRVDDIVVLKGSSAEPGWISGEAQELPLGEQEFHVHYQKTSSQGVIKLYWSSDAFALEPIPDNALLREEPSRQPYLVERGREVAEAFRCFHCHASVHQGSAKPEFTAPSLKNVKEHLAWNWLLTKLQDPTHQNTASKMPNYGFDKNDAEAVAAYLWSKSKPLELLETPELAQEKPASQKETPKEEKPIDHLAEGNRIVHTVGCLACHQVAELGNSGNFSGPELTTLGEKRTADWIYTWLEQPEKLHPQHRMPEVLLSKTEKAQVARYLATTQSNNPSDNTDPIPEFTDELLKRGATLIQQASCNSCHDMGIAGVRFTSLNLAPILPNKLDESSSCVTTQSPTESDEPTPHYGERADIDALKAYLSAGEPARHQGPLGKWDQYGISHYTAGERLLRKKNCLACHERGNGEGFKDLAGKIAASVPGQEGLSESFVPPSLNAIGDKLRDEVLSEAIAGKQERVRVDWLAIRMPRFKHTEEETAALLAYLKGHDRIPVEAPATTAIPDIPENQTEELFLTGQALVGARGFSCIACHQIGEFKPQKVEPGARGTDLKEIGQRMRKEFFFRWVQAPIRIIRGMEMPSFNRPKEGVLKEHLPSQLAAVWMALNDPRLTVPTDPSVVEQYWAVTPGENPHIVRDVFLAKDDKTDKPVSRSFAAGFDNGHSLLFDLSQPQLRLWTVGDFARQRTVGKSWFWDMAGNPLATFSAAPDFALERNGEILFPKHVDDSATRLVSYQSDDSHVEFEYLMHFEIDGEITDLRIQERLEKQNDDPRTGLKRSFNATQLPAGSRLLVSIPKIATEFGHPQVELVSSVPQETVSLDQFKLEKREGYTWVRLNSTAREIAGSWLYQCELKAPALAANLKKNEPIQATPITTVPGFSGQRLPLSRDIMPTAMTVTENGDLAFVSLKGDVYLARDTNEDGVQDQLILVEEGLASPFGIYAEGNQLLVSHKPEVLRLVDTNGDGRADIREVVATGWGYTEDYHDWTCGIVKDSQGYYYIGVGSDYAQKNRDDQARKWRGTVMRFDESGKVEPVGTAFRYPTGLAIDAQDRIFVSDQQGVQNTFNEINYLQPGKSYGVLAWQDRDKKFEETRASVQIPHPWTRSVNGLFILPEDYPVPELAGQGIGCEYNGRFLIR